MVNNVGSVVDKNISNDVYYSHTIDHMFMNIFLFTISILTKSLYEKSVMLHRACIKHHEKWLRGTESHGYY